MSESQLTQVTDVTQVTEIICSICFDNIFLCEKIHSPCTSILHIFHHNCFNQYRKSERYKYNKNCPTCRSNVSLQPMKPKGTNTRRIVNENKKLLLKNEEHKYSILCQNNLKIEEHIKKKLNLLNVYTFKREKIVVNKNDILTNHKIKQIDWLIQLNIKKYSSEKEYHKKYIKELYLTTISCSDNFTNTELYSKYRELISTFQNLNIIYNFFD